MNRRFDLALGLDRDEPFTLLAGHGDVFHGAQHFPAIAVPHPAKLGQEYTAIGLIELDLFRIRIAEAVALVFLLEAREIGPIVEEILVSSFQIFERVLQGVNGSIFQPRCFASISPCG